ncbi:phage tail protein [Deinococcus altitudinis]|uniref:phage tail protein n=1 Tax=Deinococcus altitudinis TaxID=468914 RepID=UPI003892109F
MSNPYIGEIRMFAGNFAPNGWLFCDGTLLPISEYDTLFNLIGTIYGGDGQSSFALPDLRGRVPLHQGSAGSASYTIGQQAGAESVTLTAQQLPVHSHPLNVISGTATTPAPGGQFLAAVGSGEVFISDTPTVSLNPASVGPYGGSQPHENRMPFQGVNYIISLYGIFPSPT